MGRCGKEIVNPMQPPLCFSGDQPVATPAIHLFSPLEFPHFEEGRFVEMATVPVWGQLGQL